MLDIFKSRYFWLGLGFTLLFALTGFLGWFFDWPLWGWLTAIIGLLVVGIIVLAIEFVRASRSAQQIEQSIKMQAEQQRMSSRPDKQAEIEELQERLEEAIAKLKQSKLGRGRRGQNALHALPWYMFIGPPGAGKTTAIKNSGLNFPVGTDGIRGVGGTRNCDWFFTDQAILLDTAGRYMTEREDEEEWHAFLEMLKENRKGRPVNGVIIGISIEELLDAAPDEIEYHANNIRRRTSELVERLGVRFPVYLVFTKCDLLQGFVEFFGDMTRREREQIWGCTLTDKQREESSLRALFEEEFDRLYDALVNARSERLSRSMKREERRRVYVMPLEFASAKKNLALFVDQLFQQNPYQENPEFRGFYFTSGTQEGAPIDRVIQSISRQFDFAPGLSEGAEPEMEKKSYFIKDFFTDVVVPDQYRVEQTSKSARRGRFAQLGTVAASVTLLIVFFLWVWWALNASESSVTGMKQAAQATYVVNWSGTGTDEHLQRISQLRQEIDRLEREQDGWSFWKLGLSREETVLASARGLYYQKMRPLVERQFKALERGLENQRVRSLNEQDRIALERDLENYVLLSDTTEALGEDQYRSQLIQYLSAQLIQGNAPGMAVSFRGEEGQIERHISAFVDGLKDGRVQPFASRSYLIENIGAQLQRPATIESIYSRIKQKGMSREPYRLTDMPGLQGSSSLFATNPQVPGFYTKDAWNTFVEAEIERAAETPGQGGLIGGSDPEEVSEDIPDARELERRLEARYFDEYARAWERFMAQIEYRPMGSLRETARILNTTLGSQFDSPLVRVLDVVTGQTRFRSRVEEAVNGVKEEIANQGRRMARSRVKTKGARDAIGTGGDSEDAAMHPVNRRMARIHQLNADQAESGNASRNLSASIQALQQVGVELESMTDDPARAYDEAKQIVNDGGGRLGAALRTIRRELGQLDPNIRENLFEDPIMEAWAGISGVAQQYLNERWRAEVVRPYQSSLEGRYPFVATSSQDAPINDVESFFGPQQGDVAVFYRNYLEPFVRRDGRAKLWRNRGIRLSQATRRMLQNVDHIREGLFEGDALNVTFRLQPAEQPLRGPNAPYLRRIEINIHGEGQSYAMGRFLPDTEFRWPGRRNGASLSMETSEGPLEPKQRDGSWALFRLFEEGEVERQGPNAYRVRWRFIESGRYWIDALYTLNTQREAELFASPAEFFRFSVPETIN